MPDPSSSGSPDILFTRLLYYTKCQRRKSEIIQSNSFGNLLKVNQFIYTLDTICEPNIMILAQPILEIFSSQGSIGLYWQSKKETSKKGHNSATKSPTEKKKIRVLFFSYLLHISNFKILFLTLVDHMQSVSQTRTDGQAQTKF